MHMPVKLPLNENLFLSDAIAFNMKNNPDQPFYVFAEAEDSIKIISHLEFGRAAHRIAHALRPHRSGSNGAVVGILAQTDTILYNVIIAGLIVAGLVPFPISPRNTAMSLAGMLAKTSCHRLITNDDAFSLLISGVKACLPNHEIHIENIPSLSLAFPYFAHEVSEHPFEKYPDPAERPIASDTCTILHSSGSTGPPKTIAQTHLYWMQSMSPEFRDYVPRLIIGSMSLPGFHTAGLMSQLFSPVYAVVPTAVFPPTSATPGASPIVPSPGGVLKHAAFTRSNVIFAVPSFIQAWLTLPDALDYLRSLEFLCYAGGPLPPKIGEYLVAAGVRLHPIYGGTEFGAPTCRAPTKGDEMDWEYVRFYKHMDIRWIPQGNGLYECHFLACEAHRPAVLNLPDVEGYATGDIFQPHPTKEYLWKIIGRVDDVIVHASGEKTVPGPMEVIITGNSLIESAIIFGRARNQTGVLIQLQDPLEINMNDQQQLALLRNQIWPSIEDANREAPAFSKIFKEMILFTSRDKPLPRAIKGTILRNVALDLYDTEIAALYDNVELSLTSDKSCPASWDITSIEKWIQDQAAEITSRDHFSCDVNLFEQGFDSLSATILRLRIINAMRSSGDTSLEALSRDVVQNFVYDLPTIKEIATHVTPYSLPPKGHQAPGGTNTIKAIVEKYGGDFAPLSFNAPTPPYMHPSDTIVLLTGSTGQLGSQILEKLLQDVRVYRVYALNRGRSITTLLDRHKERFKDIGIDLSLLDSRKLVLIAGDLNQPDLGIEEALYREISSSLDVLIHNAWHLDLNSPLLSYESTIQSSRHLIDLVRTGTNASRTRFLFISSVASAQSWDDSRGPVPEDIVDDASYAIGSGYGEAKYVVERLLASSGLHATVLRLGQICGNHTKGSWPITEWLPMLVKSSVNLGIIPDLAGSATWLPGNSASSVVVDVALAPFTADLFRVFNVVHPKPVDQKVIINGIVAGINNVVGVQLHIVPFHHWIMKLEAYAEKGDVETLTKIPVIKVVTFLCHYVAQMSLRTYSMNKIMNLSVSIHPANVKQLTSDDVKTWVEYWDRLGYLG